MMMMVFYPLVKKIKFFQPSAQVPMGKGPLLAYQNVEISLQKPWGGLHTTAGSSFAPRPKSNSS
jgi:hypothetical protein